MTTYGTETLASIAEFIAEALNIAADAVWSEVGLRDEGGGND